MSFVKYKLPDALKTNIKNALSQIVDAQNSKIRKGMNEVTKSIERGVAKFVVMAEDVSPPEILFHVPLLCDEKSIPYGYLSTRKDLGTAVKIKVGASAISVENVGAGNDNILEEIIKQISQLK